VLVIGAINAWFAALTPAIALLLGGGALAKAGFWLVQEGELGAMKCFGKAVRYRRGPKKGQLKIYRPGFCMPVPGIRKLVRINVRKSSLHLEDATFKFADHTVFACSATGKFIIAEHQTALDEALFGTSNLHDFIHTRARAVRMRVLANKRYTDLSGTEYSELCEELATELEKEVGERGVKILSFELTSSDPDSLTNLRIQTLELVRVSTTAVKEAAEALGLDSKEHLPLLAAALLPGTSAVVATGVTSHHQFHTNGKAHLNGYTNGDIEVVASG
jgi:regulator of protease activity HflC (stomatin/prohibitin superfamily)